MKKQMHLLTATLGFAINTFGQTALPYYTGFDNPNQQAGWAYYGEGLQDPMQLEWFYASDQPKSAPFYLNHSYWGDAASRTIDWIISPPFNFSSGATFKCAILPYVYPAVTVNDSINLYLLNGNQNPVIASKTLLGTFAQKAKQIYAWDSLDVTIPPTTGTSYIAFKYVGLDEWFTVGIDDIHISSGTTGVDDLNLDAKHEVIRFYPNPASRYIYWDINNNANRTATIFDLTGKQVGHFALDQERFDISMLPQAFYIIEVNGLKYTFAKFQ